MMWSLKSRLLAGMIGGMAVLLIAFSIVIYHFISHSLLGQFDASLRTAAQILSASVEGDQGKLGFEFDVQMMPDFAAGKKTAYYEFLRRDGSVAALSPSLAGKELVKLEPVKNKPVFKSFRMKDGQRVRAIAVNFLPRLEKNDPNKASTPQPFILVIAKDARKLHSQLHFLQYLLIIASAGIIGVACALAAVVVKQGLKPLSLVAEQIDTIKESNLGSRISGEHLPAEIVPIQRRLNSLLSRLENSFERERAFNADVAHELRTPLAGMRSIIDVTLTRVRNEAEYQSAMADCLGIINQMQAMVDNLLTLARVESGQMTFGREQIKVAELVNACWQPFSDKAAQAGLIFENHIDAELICRSDAAGLSLIFSNLLDNAAEYTNRGGRIWADAQRTDDKIEIIFNNTGSRLTSQQTAEVFESFWRGDSSRAGTGAHCGLGLALVKRISEALGGAVRAEAENGLFSVCLTVPA
jgi:signal transduction histidine kinase